SCGRAHLAVSSGGSSWAILPPSSSRNQRVPCGPAAIALWKPSSVGIGNWLSLPVGVMRPMALPAHSLNQRLPSGPAVIPRGLLLSGVGNSVTTPLVVIRPILPDTHPVNQRVRSGPAVIANGAPPTGNSLIVLPGVVRPIL